MEPSVEQAGSSSADYERETGAEKEDLKEELDPDDSGESDAVATALGDETPRQDEGPRRRVTVGRTVQV